MNSRYFRRLPRIRVTQFRMVKSHPYSQPLRDVSYALQARTPKDLTGLAGFLLQDLGFTTDPCRTPGKHTRYVVTPPYFEGLANRDPHDHIRLFAELTGFNPSQLTEICNRITRRSAPWSAPAGAEIHVLTRT